MLYIVATPIGNLDEMSFRAVEILKKVSLIAAEDTRHSAGLLSRFDIATPMISYQKFSEKRTAEGIISRLKKGEDIALISDAGMPLISDPGSVLITECLKNGVDFTVISGPCAVINAVVLSGLRTDNFVMLGFLPDKPALRKKLLEPYLFVPASLVFYTPPQSVLKDLEFLHSVLGKRKYAVVKEISKLHESVFRGVLGDTLDLNLRGEFVLVVEGYAEPADDGERSISDLVSEYIGMGLDRMDAIKRVARDTKTPKSEVYRLITQMQDS